MKKRRRRKNPSATFWTMAGASAGLGLLGGLSAMNQRSTSQNFANDTAGGAFVSGLMQYGGMAAVALGIGAVALRKQASDDQSMGLLALGGAVTAIAAVALELHGAFEGGATSASTTPPALPSPAPTQASALNMFGSVNR